MRGVNKVILAGFVSKEPKAQKFNDGGEACRFTLATSRSWTDKSTGERKEHTEWHHLVATGDIARTCFNHLEVGGKVYVEGYLQTRSWTDSNSGELKYITEIRITELEMLNRPNESNDFQDNQNNFQGNNNQQRNNNFQGNNNQQRNNNFQRNNNQQRNNNFQRNNNQQRNNNFQGNKNPNHQYYDDYRINNDPKNFYNDHNQQSANKNKPSKNYGNQNWQYNDDE